MLSWHLLLIPIEIAFDDSTIFVQIHIQIQIQIHIQTQINCIYIYNAIIYIYCKFLLRLNRIHNTWKQIKRVSQRHISLYRTKYTYCHSGFLKRLLSTKSSPHILNKLESRREKWYKRVLNNIWVNSCNITVYGFGKWKLI